MQRLWAVLIALTVAAAPLATVPLAHAQTTASIAGIELLRQPIWHGPEDRLGIELRVTNVSDLPLEGFTIQIADYSRSLSRSDLHQSFDGTTGLASSFLRYFRQITLEPGSSETVVIDNPLSQLSTVSGSLEGGVFPLTITVGDVLTRPLDSFTTHLIYYPQIPDVPLDFSLLVPLNDTPSRRPDGLFAPIGDDIPLETAVGRGGWLSSFLDAVEPVADRLRVGLAATPRFLEELADLGDGYVRTEGSGTTTVAARDGAAAEGTDALQRLRALMDNDGIQPIFVPYSFPDLPALQSHFPPEGVMEQRQFSEASDVYAGVLDQELDPRWLYPPGGRLDRVTLDRARALGTDVGRYAFFSPSSIVAAPDPATGGCPAQSPSFVCPIAVTTVEGTTQGYVGDVDLQARLDELARPGDNRLDLQHFMAETAMVREELPSVSNRVLHAALPSMWHPPAAVYRLLLRGLARAPWLRTVTPAEGLAEALEVAPRNVVETLSSLPGEPDPSFFATISQADDAVDGYLQVGPPADIARRLGRNLLVAQSRLFWSESTDPAEGLKYAEGARAEAQGELAKISVETSEEITLTSREGEVQIRVENGADYPVTLQLVLFSSTLDFEPPDVTRFDPGTTRVDVEVLADSSGASPLEVRVQTRDGFVVGSPHTISIRSTQFNEIALAVTLGALVFLILFYTFKSTRRRGAPAAGGPEGAGAA